MSWKEYLNKIYFDPAHPSAFSGPKKLYKQLQIDKHSTSHNKIKKWLQNQDAYSLMKPVKYKFKRQQVITRGLDDMWDIDLAEVGNIKEYNNNYRYLLVVIDVFSKYLWVQPIYNKTHTSVIEAFNKIFQSTNRRPRTLRSDKGAEFKNRWVKAFLKNEGIHPYTTKNETKANYAERVIRTLKSLMQRYFLHNQTYTYTDVLQALVHNYNNRLHSTLNGLTPNSINKTNEAKVWKQMYIDKLKLPKRKGYQFKIDDQVRISYKKYTFQRDYHQKWTQEVFIITDRFRKQGINLYKIKDFLNEEIDGYFYEQELQRVSKDNKSIYKIEEVIKKRKRRGQTELFVKWLGWPKKFNSWINEKDLT